ncbi:hypothetical protein BKA56DRAFT_591312 [Ilyonectria sp. MPI-CAGE-AT-0026]|nr:hypothetical protein BKA56DRAFT_591312 [Ilyonectria sp. MPI-CAGE-AT-0026]
MASNSNGTTSPHETPSMELIPDDEDDFRPATSPYGGILSQLWFKGQGPLYVPNGLLQGSPAFADRHGGSNILTIQDVSLDAGHVIVHFLYKGRYQCLKPKGETAQDKRTAEFATSLRVYSAARDYRLPLLRILATRQIRRLGYGLSLPCMLDVLHDEHPNLCDEDDWLETYIASRTRSELDDLDRPKAESLLAEIGCAATINGVLLRAVVSRELEKREVLAEELKQARRELDAHRETIKQLTTADSINEPPSVDHVELKPAAAAYSVEAEVPVGDGIPAGDEIPSAEEGYHKVAEEDFYPPTDIPPVEGQPDSVHGIGHLPSDTDIDESSQYHQREDSNLGQDLTSAEPGGEWQRDYDSLMRVTQEPSTPLFVEKKKTKKDKKKAKKARKTDSPPEPLSRVEAE